MVVIFKVWNWQDLSSRSFTFIDFEQVVEPLVVISVVVKIEIQFIFVQVYIGYAFIIKPFKEFLLFSGNCVNSCKHTSSREPHETHGGIWAWNLSWVRTLSSWNDLKYHKALSGIIWNEDILQPNKTLKETSVVNPTWSCSFDEKIPTKTNHNMSVEWCEWRITHCYKEKLDIC